MAKFNGVVGYIETVEETPGVWVERVTERKYYGDFIKNIHRYQSSDSLNDNINLASKISIVADSFASANFSFMRYVEFDGGVKWKISDVEVQRPRLILTIGGVYNG